MSWCILESFSAQLPGHSWCLGTRLNYHRGRERDSSAFLPFCDYIPVHSCR